jgi:hypothetical protein
MVKQSWIRMFQIFLVLTSCFALFQNFSLDNDYTDIREIAPAGTPAEAPSQYFPAHTRATSIHSLGNEILKHNLSDEVRQLENRIEDWSGLELGGRPTRSRGPASATADYDQSSATKYRFRTGLLGRDKVGFRLQSELNVKCEYSALTNETQISVERALGHNGNLSFKHNTVDQNSSVNFSYAW